MSDEFDLTRAHPGNWEGFFKARKKPVVVDAAQINLAEGFQVKTLEGTMIGKPGDYLLIGIKGEKYPCDKEVFEATYDRLSADSQTNFDEAIDNA